nr:MAG TPA: hypothetical protein [Caudoviricetes sp.]
MRPALTPLNPSNCIGSLGRWTPTPTRPAIVR